MAKTTSQQIIDLGFSAEMFRKDDTSFPVMIDDIIAEQSFILQGRVGVDTYGLAISPVQDYCKRVEKCLVAAELVQRRINIILSNVVGAGVEINVSHEGAQKKAYLDEANALISKIAGGSQPDSSDFVSGSMITDHFSVPDDSIDPNAIDPEDFYA